MIIHFVLSGIYGAVFGAISGSLDTLRDNSGFLIGAAVFGLALWIGLLLASRAGGDE